MAANQKYKAHEVAKAIRQAKGILAVAARNLGCHRTTVYSYLKKYASVRAAYDEARETNIDFVEGQLMAAINRGSVPAIMFFLRTVGRNRGYIERQEIEHRGSDEPVKVKFIEVVKDYGEPEK